MPQASARILVVDDHAANRTVYANWLREIHGVEVLEADDGRVALGLARKHDFALFVLDVDMPDMDGFELASLLRLEQRAEVTPIMFMTSESAPRTLLMRGYRMGAVDFMVWGPVAAEVLVQKARVFVQMFEKRRELQAIVEQVRSENRALQHRLEGYITEQEVLRQQATHDPLTHLPNRALFEDRLGAAIARAQRSRRRFALAYVDLDGFKAVNDRHGHATGDALLGAQARRLTTVVRATDTVARIGGDEFALLFEGLDSPAGAAYVAGKIHQALVGPHRLRSETDQAEVEVRTGASVGLALFPDHGPDAAELVMRADMAMYAVKRAGGGVRVFSGDSADLAPRAEPTRLQLVRSRQE